MSLVSFDRVEKRFEDKKVFSDLSLEVRKGETLSIVGGSGTGKSVLLKMLIGLLRPDAGEITVDGTRLIGLSEKGFLPIRQRISMLFQSGALFDSLTVAENIAYPLREAGRYSKEEIADRITDRLELVGLAGNEALYPSDLSGGMRKRVALARAIAGDPEMILYDEPNTGLDPINTRRIAELILSIQERLKVTSLVVTHDMPCAYMISDRLAMIHDGRIVAQLPPEEFKRAAQPEIREFIDAMAEEVRV